MKRIFYLIKKEFLLEFRQASGIASILVYLISVLFTVSLLFKNKYTPVSYSSVYLIIFLFTAILSAYKNFMKENTDGGIFNYVMYSPAQFILGKIIYSVLFNLITGFLLFVLFVLFNGNMIDNLFLFVLNISGLSVGLGALLSLMGSVSSKTGSNFALMSIMSFPLLLPLLIITAKLSIAAINGIPLSMNIKYAVSLFALDGIIILLALILFPQVWTE